MMEEKIQTRVPAEKIWDAWEKAHANHGGQKIVEGEKGVTKSSNAKKLRYQVLDVVKGERFSIVWKTLFVRLLFCHRVVSTPWGSEISYTVRIKGLFAWPIRFLLGNKIRSNISLVLKTVVQQLEREHLKN